MPRKMSGWGKRNVFERAWRAKGRENQSRAENAREIRCFTDTARVRVFTLKSKYGLDAVGFQALLEKQKGACAICQQPFTKTPCVDHNHVTGHVRGLLCRLCNLLLGASRDSPMNLVRAAAYLSDKTDH